MLRPFCFLHVVSTASSGAYASDPCAFNAILHAVAVKAVLRVVRKRIDAPLQLSGLLRIGRNTRTYQSIRWSF